MFFQLGASGLQDVSRNNGLGKGWAVPRHRRVSLTTSHGGWCQVSTVRGGREFPLSGGLPSEWGQLSHRQDRGLETGLTLSFMTMNLPLLSFMFLYCTSLSVTPKIF